MLLRNLFQFSVFLVILTKNVLKLSLKHFIMIFAGTDKFEVDPRSGEVRVVQPIDREDRDEGFNVNGEIRLTVTIQVEQSTYLKLNFLHCKVKEKWVQIEGISMTPWHKDRVNCKKGKYGPLFLQICARRLRLCICI